MTSRHIPEDVSKKVRSRHFFECAWCGEKITERHHIEEFHLGGQHTVENLILLCRNCHRQVHLGEIDALDLITRKSNHVKGDRIAGGVQFDIEEQVVRIGGATFVNVDIPIMIGDQPMFKLTLVNGEYFLSARFFNKEGDLIFWMSSNRFWAESEFTVTLKKKEINIVSEDNTNYLRIVQVDDRLELYGSSYLHTKKFDFNPVSLMLPNGKFTAMNLSNMDVGIKL